MKKNTLRIAALFLLTSSLTSCLHRRETLEIQDDGQIHVRHVISGHPADMDGGAACMPKDGFQLERTNQKKPNSDEVEAKLVAEAKFQTAGQMPTRFAPRDAAHPEAALQFSTIVDITTDARGKVYRFKRTYSPRHWADYAAYWRSSLSSDLRRLIESPGADTKEFDEPTIRQLVLGLINYERLKVERWARLAVASTATDENQAALLRMRLNASIESWIHKRASVDYVTQLIRSEDRDLDDEGERIHREVRTFVLKEIGEFLNLDQPSRLDVARAYDEARTEFEVSEDLRDESFVVRIRLPGELLGHNGAKVVDGYLEWHFDGESLRDRQVTLEAMSVLKP